MHKIMERKEKKSTKNYEKIIDNRRRKINTSIIKITNDTVHERMYSTYIQFYTDTSVGGGIVDNWF